MCGKEQMIFRRMVDKELDTDLCTNKTVEDCQKMRASPYESKKEM